MRLEGNITSTIRSFDTANVIARLEGSDPHLKNEAVLYSAHHDHLGIGTPDENDPTDTIYNGADRQRQRLRDDPRDRARLEPMSILVRSGASSSPSSPRKSKGSSARSTSASILPSRSERSRLGINLDALDLYGRVGSVTMIGVEKMDFLPTAQLVTKALDLTIVPDQAPEQGSYYRSDHFSFAKAGVPAFSIKQGFDVVGKPPEYGREKSEEYRSKHYHQPSDEMDPSWNFDSAVQIGEPPSGSAGKPRTLPRCPCGTREKLDKTADVRKDNTEQ